MDYLVNTQDPARTIKVANEARTRILAMDLWPDPGARASVIFTASRVVRETFNRSSPDITGSLTLWGLAGVEAPIHGHDQQGARSPRVTSNLARHQNPPRQHC